MKYFFICLFFALSLLGCNSNEKSKHEESPNQIDSLNLKLKNNLVNRPKLFLKFWANMSEQEFDTVVKILIADKILEQKDYRAIFYLTPNCKSELKPLFVNESLKEIKLSNGLCLYDLYKQKYNLPNLVEKRLVDRKNKEKNGEYSPTMYFVTETGPVTLPNCFKDNSYYTSSGQTNLEIDKNGIKEKVLKKSPVVIEKNESIIIFEQSFYKSPSPSITYSLDLSPEMQKYKLKHPLISLKEEGNYISLNSKYKIVEIISNSVINITYLTKADYYLENKNKIKDKNSIEQENQKLKHLNKLRTASVLDEI